MEEHQETLSRLAETDTLEYDMCEYLLNNKELLQEKLKVYKKDYADFFPDSLYGLYLEQYKDVALDLIRNEVGVAFQLDPENRLRLTISLINKVGAEELLSPQKGSI